MHAMFQPGIEALRQCFAGGCSPKLGFRQCMLGGLLLIAALLSVGALHSWWLLENHVERNRQNEAQSVLLGTTLQELAERTVDVERGVRQYRVLGDASLVERIADSANRCRTLVQQLEDLGGAAFLATGEQWRATLAALSKHVQRAPRSESVLEYVATLRRLNAEFEQQGKRWIDARQQAAHHELAASRTRVAILAVIAALGAFAIALAMGRWLSRPVEQLQAAICQLGENRFEVPVQVAGPADLQLVGRRLEWLRRRLGEFEAERERALRQVAHELKTPLTALREGISLLRDEVGGSLGTTQMEIVDILQHNVVTLQGHIESLLRLKSVCIEARHLNLAPLALSNLLGRAVECRMLQIQARALRVSTDAPEVTCLLDEEKMLVVLDNLLSNAIDFSHPCGTIRLAAELAGGRLRIICQDSGEGVAEEDRERIFEPFVQGTRQPTALRQGSGVGLSIVRELMLAMGGGVRVEPALSDGCGAAFVLDLPARCVAAGGGR